MVPVRSLIQIPDMDVCHLRKHKLKFERDVAQTWKISPATFEIRPVPAVREGCYCQLSAPAPL
jgi:hypothetical protein